jgi:hypothetical protein
VLVRGLNCCGHAVVAAGRSGDMREPAAGGKSGSARGAESFVRESIGAGRAAGAGGTVGDIVVMRGDSAFYTAGVIAACRDGDVWFSFTAKMDPKIKAAIAAIPERVWIAIKYPRRSSTSRRAGARRRPGGRAAGWDACRSVTSIRWVIRATCWPRSFVPVCEKATRSERGWPSRGWGSAV